MGRKNNLIKKAIPVVLAISLFSPLNVFAEDLDSSNYHIIDFSFGPVGSEETGNSSYDLLLSSAEATRDDRFIGTNYIIGVGVANTWKASVPEVECFETVSEGVTTCSDPDIAGGMVEICGGGGCYNRARIEIDPQSNSSDTLYSVQITTDPSWNTFDFVDGSTFLVETVSTHNLNDYLTEAAWESTASSFNIFGLDYQTQYYVRVTALHGDFTETEPGPDATAITGVPQVSIDIDIADNSGATTETSSPYAIDLGELTLGAVNTAQDEIWLDLDTNLTNGARTFIRGQNEGLFTFSGGYTIPSTNIDLATAAGFGLQNSTFNQTFLGALAVAVDFDVSGENVGGIPDEIYAKEILNTSLSPIYQGRASFLVKARPDEQSPYADDYTETIVITAAADF